MILILESKKGTSFFDLILFSIVLLVLALGFSTWSWMAGQTNNMYQNSDIFSNQTKAESQAKYTQTTSSNDYAFFLMYIVITLGAVYVSWIVDTNPIFIFIGIFFYIISIFASAVVSNVFEKLTMFSNMPITSFMMANLPIFVAISGGLILGALLIKGNSAPQ